MAIHNTLRDSWGHLACAGPRTLMSLELGGEGILCLPSAGGGGLGLHSPLYCLPRVAQLTVLTTRIYRKKGYLTRGYP